MLAAFGARLFRGTLLGFMLMLPMGMHRCGVRSVDGTRQGHPSQGQC
jgi:hypothetical protein